MKLCTYDKTINLTDKRYSNGDLTVISNDWSVNMVSPCNKTDIFLQGRLNEEDGHRIASDG